VEEITEEAVELVERVAGLDIGKASLVCCVQVPDDTRPGWDFLVGAAYRNRTDDLRITRSPRPRSGHATCTDSSTRVPECSWRTACSRFRATTRATVRPALR
jgi:hypothetical protein